MQGYKVEEQASCHSCGSFLRGWEKETCGCKKCVESVHPGENVERGGSHDSMLRRGSMG